MNDKSVPPSAAPGATQLRWPAELGAAEDEGGKAEDEPLVPPEQVGRSEAAACLNAGDHVEYELGGVEPSSAKSVLHRAFPSDEEALAGMFKAEPEPNNVADLQRVRP